MWRSVALNLECKDYREVVVVCYGGCGQSVVVSGNHW